jgi:hypothetical protein
MRLPGLSVAALVLATLPAIAARGQCELARIRPQGGTDADLFGASVAVSADGTRIVVGATTAYDPGAGDWAGAVYVCDAVSPDAGWTQQVELRADDAEAGDLFGASVAVSADGTVLAIAAPGAEHQGVENAGVAYIFTWDGNSWTQQNRLAAAAPAPGDALGQSIGLSSDGATLIVTSSNVGNGTGAAYVFVHDGQVWTPQATLTASDGTPGERFGSAVAISDDGNTALVGARLGDTAHGGFTGSAFVFVRVGQTWSQQAKLVASDAAIGDGLGTAVAVSADGATALVGAPSEGAPFSLSGAAYVFVQVGQTWTEHAKLTAFDAGPSDNFGDGVALAADGLTALIGARQDTNAGEGSGSVYVLVRENDTWSHRYKSTATDAAPHKHYGTAIAKATVGDVVVIGAEGSATVPVAGTAHVLLVGDIDCNENGATDACDIAPVLHNYVTDDGGAESWRGASGGGDLIWFNRFGVYAGAEVLETVEVAWGDIPEGTPAQIAIWTDPDDDGDPADAELVVLTPPVLVTNPATGLFATVYVPPIFVGHVGEFFFVGVFMTHATEEAPAALDESEPQGRSWMALGDRLEILSQNDALGPVSSFGHPGNWLIRTADAPTPSSGDVDGNGVPDECEVMGDIDGDGVVGIGDFLLMLAMWGPCPEPCPPCPADLNADCDVGVVDFLILLSNWMT